MWLVLLEGLWAMLVGTQQDTELAAGFVAAAFGAIFADALRGRGLLDYTTDFRMLGQAWRFVWIVPFDFMVVTWVLLRSIACGRRVRGAFVRTSFPTKAGSVGRWQRAFAATLSTGAPNAIIVDLDEAEALLHSLETRVFTGCTMRARRRRSHRSCCSLRWLSSRAITTRRGRRVRRGRAVRPERDPHALARARPAPAGERRRGAVIPLQIVAVAFVACGHLQRVPAGEHGGEVRPVTYLPYALSMWIFVCGLYGIVSSRNLIHITVCVSVCHGRS